MAAKACVENEWTFIYLKDTEDLAQAIEFARMYQPAMIFAEDIDKVMEENEDDENREVKVHKILNTIDGVDTKNAEIIVVLTTNFKDNIPQAMLRPGRLDAVISVRPPDAAAVQKLIRLFGRSLIRDNEDLSAVGEHLQGQIPAIIREVVERSKLMALYKNGTCEHLTGEHLLASAKGMLSHLELLKPKSLDERSDMEKAADILATVAREGMAHDRDNGTVVTQTFVPTEEKEKAPRITG